ncbi:tetrapyrrole methyltransferase [Brachybacterium endophyticum]|uniref:Tetrapyrrole methyltransferase n=2 Tax=Brachybacterium endophyticum TaxID=2182385 RepID=A0A2U2RMI5_9MICO|nr:tetrapyrrole methyltransferase [Brachybacterium endophyticum]
MEALRAADGDAWSALQTHHSLARYLLEETHEVLEAIEEGSPGADGPLPDELGDLLFQILFHSRLGQEESPAWDVDDVARAFIGKMERRNPHVFGDRPQSALEDRDDVEAIIAQWHAVKAAEKAGSEASPAADAQDQGSGVDPAWSEGIPHALPALQSAAKTVHRARSAGRIEDLVETAQTAAEAEDAEQWGADVALALLEVVRSAEQRDIDPESALRTLLARTRG